MDVTARGGFWATMRELAHDRERTLVFATHYLQEAADFADRIVIIDNGRLVADGTIDELRARRTGATVTATWPGLTGPASVRKALSQVTGTVESLDVHGEHVEIRTSAPDDVARLLLTAMPATHLGISAPSLDEIFTGLVESSAAAGTAPVAAR